MRVIAAMAACVVLLGLLSTCSLRRIIARPQTPASEASGVDAGAIRVVTRAYKARGRRYVPMDVQAALKYSEEGIASYYEANGARGALGERLRRGEFYAAHPTLPMPCKVRITNLSNGKSCEARVADRGPFSRNRLIDVSSAVAKKLDFHRKGLQKVRVEVISVGDEPKQILAEK